MTIPFAHPASEPRPDRFVERLAAAAACAVALITAGYGCYFVFVRAPSFLNIARDFGVSLPLATRVALEMPWIPLLVALVALIFGILALAGKERALLILAFILTSLAVAATITAEVAARWSLDQVFRSIAP
jgi:hypothetical protein